MPRKNSAPSPGPEKRQRASRRKADQMDAEPASGPSATPTGQEPSFRGLMVAVRTVPDREALIPLYRDALRALPHDDPRWYDVHYEIELRWSQTTRQYVQGIARRTLND